MFLGKLLTLPLMGPINTVAWLANTLEERIEAELYNEDALRGTLLELELRYDMGEISEEEYSTAEEQLLERLAFIRERKRQQNGG